MIRSLLLVVIFIKSNVVFSQGDKVINLTSGATFANDIMDNIRPPREAAALFPSFQLTASYLWNYSARSGISLNFRTFRLDLFGGYSGSYISNWEWRIERYRYHLGHSSLMWNYSVCLKRLKIRPSIGIGYMVRDLRSQSFQYLDSFNPGEYNFQPSSVNKNDLRRYQGYSITLNTSLCFVVEIIKNWAINVRADFDLAPDHEGEREGFFSTGLGLEWSFGRDR